MQNKRKKLKRRKYVKAITHRQRHALQLVRAHNGDENAAAKCLRLEPRKFRAILARAQRRIALGAKDEPTDAMNAAVDPERDFLGWLDWWTGGKVKLVPGLPISTHRTETSPTICWIEALAFLFVRIRGMSVSRTSACLGLHRCVIDMRLRRVAEQFKSVGVSMPPKGRYTHHVHGLRTIRVNRAARYRESLADNACLA